jgi:hypothetical protein
MDVSHATAGFTFLPLRLRIVPQQVLKLPTLSKTNTLRCAFGMAFRPLLCIPQCREVRLGPRDEALIYAQQNDLFRTSPATRLLPRQGGSREL